MAGLPPGPEGRLEAIRRVFFSQPMSLGTHPIQQRRQPEVPENARWEWGGVVFATLNVPGPSGGGPTLEADLVWLDKTFDRAKEIKAPAVMIIWQDDPVDGSSPALVSSSGSGRRPSAGRSCWSTATRTATSSTTPGRTSPNLTRLETFPTFTPEWVKVIVDPARPGRCSPSARLRA